MIPAVDVLDGQAVRLEQGDYERVALRAGSPEELVERLATASPALIHLVDLDGARRGGVDPDLVARAVARANGVPVQASGGIRSLADAELLLAAGADRVVVGTAAFAGEETLEELASHLGPRLVVAIDAREGKLAVAGWRRETDLEPAAAAARCAAAGVARLLCTSIERDGTLDGPDLALLSRVRDASELPVLAAGGIRSQDDLARLRELGLEGAIVGRALLEGRIPLAAVGARRV